MSKGTCIDRNISFYATMTLGWEYKRKPQHVTQPTNHRVHGCLKLKHIEYSHNILSVLSSPLVSAVISGGTLFVFVFVFVFVFSISSFS